MTYPTYQQYTFVKIFYETPEEENKAFFLMEGIKNIIKEIAKMDLAAAKKAKK